MVNPSIGAWTDFDLRYLVAEGQKPTRPAVERFRSLDVSVMIVENEE